MLGRIKRLQFLVEENNNRSFSAKNDDDTKLMTSIVTKHMKYCEAGLAHLEQSLCQKDACSEEGRWNLVSCLFEKAHLRHLYDRLDSRLRKYGVCTTFPDKVIYELYGISAT